MMSGYSGEEERRVWDKSELKSSLNSILDAGTSHLIRKPERIWFESGSRMSWIWGAFEIASKDIAE